MFGSRSGGGHVALTLLCATCGTGEQAERFSQFRARHPLDAALRTEWNYVPTNYRQRQHIRTLGRSERHGSLQ